MQLSQHDKRECSLYEVMMNDNDLIRSLRFRSMGLRYLHFVRLIAEQVVNMRNKSVATWWGERTPQEEAEEFDRQTKWSDATVVEPLLFNFYHGLELLLKGFVLLESVPDPNHRLTHLLKYFVAAYPSETELITLFQKYLSQSAMPEILIDFLEKNESSVDRFFESLRYPFNRNLSRNYKHTMLKYKQSEGLPFYEELVADIGTMDKYAVALGRKLERR